MITGNFPALGDLNKHTLTKLGKIKEPLVLRVDRLGSHPVVVWRWLLQIGQVETDKCWIPSCRWQQQMELLRNSDCTAEPLYVWKTF